MTRLEEIKILRNYPHHYLWQKQRKDWTAQDKINLQNITPDQIESKRPYFKKRSELETETTNF